MDAPTTEGTVNFTCSACSARYPLNWTLAGKTIHCKSCGQPVTAGESQMEIPAQVTPEALRQINDALVEAAGLAGAAQTLLLEFNRQQERKAAARAEEAKAAEAARAAALEERESRLKDMEARLQEERALTRKRENEVAELAKKHEAELAEMKLKYQAQEDRLFATAAALKAREEKLQSLSQKESMLRTLCDSIESNLKKDIDSHQNLLASLRQQLKFG